MSAKSFLMAFNLDMKQATSSPSNQRGFTLIQVMLILGLLGVVLTVATSAYLKHQSKHYVKEALVEAGQARQVVAENAKSDTEGTTKDWAKGYAKKTGENHSWTVYVDPTSAAVVVTLWLSKDPQTLLWVPLKGNPTQAESGSSGQISEGGLNWVCVLKDETMPDVSKLFAPLSATVPKADFSGDLVTSDCR